MRIHFCGFCVIIRRRMILLCADFRLLSVCLYNFIFSMCGFCVLRVQGFLPGRLVRGFALAFCSFLLFLELCSCPLLVVFLFPPLNVHSFYIFHAFMTLAGSIFFPSYSFPSVYCILFFAFPHAVYIFIHPSPFVPHCEFRADWPILSGRGVFLVFCVRG